MAIDKCFTPLHESIYAGNLDEVAAHLGQKNGESDGAWWTRTAEMLLAPNAIFGTAAEFATSIAMSGQRDAILFRLGKLLETSIGEKDPSHPLLESESPWGTPFTRAYHTGSQGLRRDAVKKLVAALEGQRSLGAQNGGPATAKQPR